MVGQGRLASRDVGTAECNNSRTLFATRRTEAGYASRSSSGLGALPFPFPVPAFVVAPFPIPISLFPMDAPTRAG